MLLRRSISSLLCWLLLTPSLFALVTTAPQQPECCRRGGVHHCAMAMTDAGMEASGGLVKASNLCPYQHAPAKLHVNASSLLLRQRHSALAVSLAAMVAHKVQEFDSAALERSSRGPPPV